MVFQGKLTVQSTTVLYMLLKYIIYIFLCSEDILFLIFGLKLISSYMLQRFDLMWHLLSLCLLFKKKKKKKPKNVSFYTLGKMGLYLMWAAEMGCRVTLILGGGVRCFSVFSYACARAVGMTVF